jgi:hypothetical protein
MDKPPEKKHNKKKKKQNKFFFMFGSSIFRPFLPWVFLLLHNKIKNIPKPRSLLSFSFSIIK